MERNAKDYSRIIIGSQYFLYFGVIGLYLLLVLVGSIATKDLRLMPLVFAGIITMHLT